MPEKLSKVFNPSLLDIPNLSQATAQPTSWDTFLKYFIQAIEIGIGN